MESAENKDLKTQGNTTTLTLFYLLPYRTSIIQTAQLSNAFQ